MYDLGEGGIKDYNKMSNKIIPATKKLTRKTEYGVRLKRLSAKVDVDGFDHPRDDIKNIHLKNKKIVRIGSDNPNKTVTDFKKYILPSINNAFTKNELKNLDIYIEYPSKNISQHFSGLSTGWSSNKNKKFSTIDLTTNRDADTAVHEILHAMKYENGTMSHNVNKDESETTLETYIRLTPKLRKKVSCDDGYYGFIKGNKCKARKDDVKIIESNCNIKNKSGLTKCIKKNLHKTNLGKIKIPKKYIPKE